MHLYSVARDRCFLAGTRGHLLLECFVPKISRDRPNLAGRTHPNARYEVTILSHCGQRQSIPKRHGAYRSLSISLPLSRSQCHFLTNRLATMSQGRELHISPELSSFPPRRWPLRDLGLIAHAVSGRVEEHNTHTRRGSTSFGTYAYVYPQGTISSSPTMQRRQNAVSP